MPLTVLFVSFLLLMFLRCPIGFSLGTSCVFYFLIKGDYPLQVIAQQLSASIQGYIFLAIPFFVLASSLMNEAGMTRRLFNFALSVVGSLRGGLCHVVIVAEIIISGISGSAAADALGLATVSIETMVKKGYPRGFSAGVVACTAVLGPIIPPSIIFIIYAAIAEVSVGKLFLAGFLPGFLIAFFLMCFVYYMALKKNFPREEKATWSKIWASFKDGYLALFAPFVILGGLVVGVFTPTEAGAIAVIYSIILGLIYREFPLKQLPKILMESAYTTALLMFIISTASLFGWILVNERVADLMTSLLFSISNDKWVIMILINLILLFMGCFMDTSCVCIITIPVFVPIITKIGFDPVYFGVVLTLNVMIGTLTPPVGLLLYIIAHVAGISISRAIREILPFYIPLVISLIIIVFYPWITMVLPNLLMK